MVVHHLVGCAGLLGTDNWLANSNNITAYDIQYNTHITFRHYFFFFISRIVLFISWLYTSPRLSSSYNRFQTFEKILNLMRVVSFQWTFFFSRCLAFTHNHSLSLSRSLSFSLSHFLARFLSFFLVQTTQRLIFWRVKDFAFVIYDVLFFFI